jgi:RHS repeat-associated protein
MKNILTSLKNKSHFYLVLFFVFFLLSVLELIAQEMPDTANNYPAMSGISPVAFSGEERPDKGGFSLNESLVNLKGRQGLDVDLPLHYNSAIYDDTSASGLANVSYIGSNGNGDIKNIDMLGVGTSLSYGRLIEETAFSYVTNIVAAQGFLCNEPLNWNYPGGRPGAITYTNGQGEKLNMSSSRAKDIRYSTEGVYKLITYPNGMRIYFRKITRIQNPYQHHFSYANGFCAATGIAFDDVYFPWQIRDTNGNYITINYIDPNINVTTPKISNIIDTLGRKINFIYNSNQDLEKISVQSFNSGVEEIVATFYYSLMYRNHSFQGSTGGGTIKVLSKVVLPKKKQALLFWYSSYGMAYRIERNKNVITDTAGNTIDWGTTFLYTQYNYPTTPINHPQYLIKYSNRQDGVLNNATSSFDVRSQDYTFYNEPIQYGVSYKAISTVIDSFGTQYQTKRKSYDTAQRSNKVDDGVILETTISNNNKVWARDIYNWDLQASQPRLISKTHTNDEGLTTTSAYTYYNDVNLPPSRVATMIEYGFNNEQLRKTTYAYETRQQYINQWVVNLVTNKKLFDSNNNLVSELSFEYDSIPLEVAYSNVVGFVDLPWNERGNVTKVIQNTNPSNPSIGQEIVTQTQYDRLGNMVKQTDAKGYVTTYDYSDNFGSADGEARSNQPPTQLNGQNTFAYITSVTNPKGYKSYSQFDYFTGLNVNQEDLNGVINKTVYNDTFNRPTQTVSAIGTSFERQSNITYDDVNLRVETKADIFTLNDNLARSESYYDELGRTIEIRSYESDGGYISTKTEFDLYSRIKRFTNQYRPLRNEQVKWSEKFYDPLGRDIKTKTPDLSEIKTEFAGNSFIVTGETDKKRRFLYNGLGQIIRVDEPGENGQLDGVNQAPVQPTYYEYDALNNVKKVIQGSQEARTFNYDSLSRLLSSYNPESGLQQYAYDANGNTIQETDARGVVASYSYDNLNRILTSSYTPPSNGMENYQQTPNITYTYDNPTILNSKGKLTKLTNGFATTEYTKIDVLGRITESRQTIDSKTYDPMKYVYNLSGNLVEETYPSGRVVRNVYDNDGDLSQVKARKNENTGIITYASHFIYESHGAISSMQLGNGKWESAQFNERLQTTGIGLGSVQNSTDKLKIVYNYGTPQFNDGDITSQNITVSPDVASIGFSATQNYTYDSLNRLKQATEFITGQQNSSWKQTFIYHRYGNRTFDESNTTTLVKNCVDNNGLPIVCANERNNINPSADIKNRLIGHQYDNAGNIKFDASGRKFTYDSNNKQVKIESGSTTVGEYFYDGNGNRVKKYVSATQETTIFIYDAFGKMVSEYSTNVASVSVATTTYSTADILGSPRVTTNADGKVIARHDYQPFGEEITRANYGNDSVRQKFTGYERDGDGEAGLDFAKARMFQSRFGRFTSPDPYLPSAEVGNPQTWNRYAYTFNNPLVYVDPTGLITDFIDEKTGERTRVEDHKDQVIVAKTNQIKNFKALWDAGDPANRTAYYNGLARFERTWQRLSITPGEFTLRVATTYGESSAFRSSAGYELGTEMKAIAYVNQRNGVAYGAHNEQSDDYRSKSFANETDKMRLANLAIVNQVTGGWDPSNGATGWDGREQALFADDDKRASTGNFEIRKNTGGWSIRNEDYAKWKQNVGKGFVAPQVSEAAVGRNKGQIRYYSTAVYGNTIFWEIR